MSDLLQRLIRSPAFRWRRGMATASGRLVTWVGTAMATAAAPWSVRMERVPIGDLAGDPPDLSDPATVGALLGLVRDLTQGADAVVRWHGLGEWVVELDGGIVAIAETEGEAVAAALIVLGARARGRG